MLRLPAILLAALCAACVGSPVPEPPNLDIARVTAVGSSGTGSSIIEGAAGAATPGAEVWGVNLEATTPPVAGAAAEDGSFALILPWMDGEELRLQARGSDGTRDAPIDAIPPDLRAPARPLAGCLTLEPALEVDLDGESGGAPVTRAIALDNACGSTVTIAAVRLRAPSAVLTSLTTAPFDVADGASATIEVQYAPGSAGTHEEILFIEVGAPSMERRPITLIGN